MNYVTGIFGAAMIFAAGTLVAQTTAFSKLADWDGKATEANGIFTVKGSVYMQTKKTFDVVPGKTYTLKATAKNMGAEASLFYFGFAQFDKAGKQIFCVNAANVAGTDTELAAAAKKGDLTIQIKDGAKWKSHAWFAIAYNTDPSFSDLPNFNIINIPAKSIVKNGNAWTVTLSKPLTIDLAAGAKVRQQSHGGYMYAGGYGKLTSDWKTFTGSAKDNAKAGFPNNQFAPGTAKVKVIMLVNWGNQKATSELKDISLDIK